MTVEAAIALASIVTVIVTCLGAIMAVSLHIRCVDAAREAARSVARGGEVPEDVIPRGAVVTVLESGGFVTARVESDSALPGLTVGADAVAAVEPR